MGWCQRFFSVNFDHRVEEFLSDWSTGWDTSPLRYEWLRLPILDVCAAMMFWFGRVAATLARSNEISSR